MNKLLKENNYVIIENFLDKSYVNQLHQLIHQDINLLFKDDQCPLSKSIYNYRWFLEILVNKSLSISEFLEETVLPTYCYARIYQNDEILEKHLDRPACEISVTVHIGSDGTDWPIYFTKPNGEIASINLKPGQAVIYLGMLSEHWRESFQGQHYTQLFLHYVRARGEHWVYYFDKK